MENKTGNILKHISIDEILSLVNLEKITIDEINKSIRQFRKRYKKIRDHKLGPQHSWLITVVEPIDESSSISFVEWLCNQMQTLSYAMPNSMYKAIVAYLSVIDFAASHFKDDVIVQQFDTLEGQIIKVLPSLGIIAFHAPPGNLKRSFEFHNIEVEWNWSIATSLFSEKSHQLGSEEKVEKSIKNNIPLANLHKKYGKGKGTTIAILDSGICSDSSEVSECLIWQGQIKKINGKHRINRVEENFKPKSDHGTQVASLVSGQNLGVAPEAEVISFVVPRLRGKLFDHMAIFVMLEEIKNDRGVLLNAEPLNEKIDILLLPLGRFFSKNKGRKYKRNVEKLLLKFNQKFHINIIASVGNQSGKSAFPSSFPFVHSVGYLDEDGARHSKSGYSNDVTGVLPNSSVVGEKLLTQGRGNKFHFVSGSSFATAVVAGYFALLTSHYRSAEARLTCINNATYSIRDDIGELKLLNLNQLL